MSLICIPLALLVVLCVFSALGVMLAFFAVVIVLAIPDLNDENAKDMEPHPYG